MVLLTAGFSFKTGSWRMITFFLGCIIVSCSQFTASTAGSDFEQPLLAARHLIQLHGHEKTTNDDWAATSVERCYF